MWTRLWVPEATTTRRWSYLIVVSWVIVWLGWWTVGAPVVFPSPVDVIRVFPSLWTDHGLGHEVLSSLDVSIEALALAVLISAPLAYVSRVPALRPLALGLAKLRFVSPAVFYPILIFMLSTGHGVKVVMLAIGESVFLVTTFIGIVQAIPPSQKDDARTLRMSPWQATWYVVVRGTLPQFIDAIRDNQAMGWSMLMMVEGFVRSEGGVGVLILSQEKFMSYDAVYAVAAVVVLGGIAQDAFLGQVRAVVCPYAEVA